MTKISIHGEIEFIPDAADAKEAMLLNLIEDHMGKDMREVMEEYVSSVSRAEELEYEALSLRERLEEAKAAIAGLEEAFEEKRWKRS